ncbi:MULTISPECIES: sugar O-acetyltransferase [unclassified Lacticaseibacillus]|uniref:sugar O-acetyltransferase n=1 Tax=unclassified Lacticaseibacillus TaxID=2759744 RepID=UPI001944402C|nr:MULTISPECIES: sugar O-acetyltransferase [unclassified Lacticaseibacillus]
MSSIDHDRMLAGRLYDAGAEDLHQARMRSRLLTESYNRTSVADQAGRRTILTQLFKAFGEGGYIEPRLQVDYGSHISIGKNFYANYDPILLDVAPITIGDNVLMGPRVSLLTPAHPIDTDVRNAGLEYAKPITIGDNVWFGGECTVLPGVTIGSNVVIGAGAVVTKDVPDSVVVVGNPARVMRPITDADAQFWQAKQQAYLADMTTQAPTE